MKALIVGIKQHLTIPGWTTVFGPTIMREDRQIILTPYGVGGNETENGDFVQAVQFRYSGPKDGGLEPVLDVQAAVFAVFNDMRDTTLNGFHIVRAWRQSDAPPGLDGQRVEIFDNYYFRSDRLGRAG